MKNVANSGKVSGAVVRRLPGYYRYLCDLERDGLVRISSQELGSRMGLTASQIRQDINCFGGFGQQGYGYNVSELRKRIGEILGLDEQYSMVVVGAGNIGQGLAKYSGFRRQGFVVKAMFDRHPEHIGAQADDVAVLPVEELEEYVRENHIAIGVITTPAASAQQICDVLVKGGVRAIWNFASVDLNVPEGIALQNVHLSDTLMVLSYHMRNQRPKD